jgi:hypothetical protein
MALPPQALRDDKGIRPATQLVAWGLWHPVADKDLDPCNWWPVEDPGKPNDLVRITGLSRSAIYRGLARLESIGWTEQQQRPNPWNHKMQMVHALRRTLLDSTPAQPVVGDAPPKLRVVPTDFEVSAEEREALQAMLDALITARAEVGFPVVKYSFCKSNCEDALALLRAGVATPELLVEAVKSCVWRDAQQEREDFAQGQYATPSRPFGERSWQNTITYVASWRKSSGRPNAKAKAREKGRFL